MDASVNGGANVIFVTLTFFMAGFSGEVSSFHSHTRTAFVKVS